MFSDDSFRGTNPIAFVIDVVLLASVIGIPVWLLLKLLKKDD